jgi:hypothetical protein
MEFKTPKTPEDLNKYSLQLDQMFWKSSNDGFFESLDYSKLDEINNARQAILNRINKKRKKGNKAISFYGPWISCEDGSIDYGPNEMYYLSAGWHNDKWILPHVLSKPWRVGTAMDLLRAMRDAATVIGVENLDVDLKKIY